MKIINRPWFPRNPKRPKKKQYRGGPAVNPRRRADKVQMEMLGITSKKRFRKWQRAMRRIEREGR
jgi:hypothetical protein